MITPEEAAQIKQAFSHLPVDMILVYQAQFCPPPTVRNTVRQAVISSDGVSEVVWGYDAGSILEALQQYLKISAFC